MLPAGIVVLERGWLSSNNVLLLGDRDAALVDSGYWTHADQTSALVAAALGNLPLVTLANTHLHSDHCGGNAALQAQFPAAKTFIPPGLAAAVREWDPVALSHAPTGQYCPPFRIDGLLQPGTSVELGRWTWQVHSAPGHDPDSVILFEPDSAILISADALWENGFGIVFQELEGERAFEEVAGTLDLIEHLRPKVVIPGHGQVFGEVDAALARARSRLDAYVANPQRHAAHAAKVLLKFKLLELQRARLSDFMAWAETAPYFELVRARWYPDARLGDWLPVLIEDLLRSGAIARDGEFLINS
jgi:glyoxylase-like metal-dependent hydrolase (beta-lactamase superfamily II)